MLVTDYYNFHMHVLGLVNESSTVGESDIDCIPVSPRYPCSPLAQHRDKKLVLNSSYMCRIIEECSAS